MCTRDEFVELHNGLGVERYTPQAYCSQRPSKVLIPSTKRESVVTENSLLIMTIFGLREWSGQVPVWKRFAWWSQVLHRNLNIFELCVCEFGFESIVTKCTITIHKVHVLGLPDLMIWRRITLKQ